MKMINLIIGILEYENIPYEPITDLGVLMRYKRGCANPTTVCGVYVYPNHPELKTIITDFYEAVDFIRKNALRQC